jgi:lipopolysaccharide/colanic/teichoic acid biosynthesis glycosyltransferase
MIRVIRHHASVGVLPLLLSEIGLLFGCFYAAAEILEPPSSWDYLFNEGGITLVLLAIATIILAMYFFDLYAEVQVSSRVLLLQQICQSLGVAILAQTVAAYVFRDWTVPQLMMLYSCGFALVALFCWRIVFGALVRRIGPLDKLLFLGRNDTSEAVARAIELQPNSGYRVIGFLDDNPAGAHVLGGFSALRQMVEVHKPSLLVVGMPERRSAMPVGDLVALRFGGLQIEEASKTYESVYQRVRLQDLSEQQVMFSRAFVPRPSALNFVRLIGFLLATQLLLLLSPLLAAIALWLRITSSGPVLLRLPRVGKDGRVFQMLRFRAAPKLLRFHLDALPQLINVLRGEMSLVGPYAESREQASALESQPFHRYRTAVPPGITGWAQIHQTDQNRGDQALTLEYDLYYIKHMSQALDLYILVHSLKNRVFRA